MDIYCRIGKKGTIKVSEYSPANGLGVFRKSTDLASIQSDAVLLTKTPIEASRNEFGEDFVNFIRSKY
jgi:hypothetical protein